MVKAKEVSLEIEELFMLEYGREGLLIVQVQIQQWLVVQDTCIL